MSRMAVTPIGRYQGTARETREGIRWTFGNWWTALEAFPVF